MKRRHTQVARIRRVSVALVGATGAAIGVAAAAQGLINLIAVSLRAAS